MRRMSVEMPCANCKQVISIDVFEAKIVNTFTQSMIIVDHPFEVTCSCGEKVIPQIAALGGLGFAAIPTGKQALVVPPANSNLRKGVV